MGKKQDAYYFNTFTACAEDACRAAQLLKSVLENFKPEELETQLEKLHEIEHSADEKKHDIWIIWQRSLFRRLKEKILYL